MNKVDARGPSGFLALGDSYTIGEGVEDSQRWPAQLVARLRGQGFEIDAPKFIATTGWTTDELQDAIDAAEFTPPYALVSLLIGVNNQYRGRDLDNYADEFSSLLDFAVGMAGRDPSKLLVVSIPDWGATRFAVEQGADTSKIAAQIDQFNRIARSHAEARGAQWIDVTGISRGQPSGWLTQDGLHPSAEQYACWVEAIAPYARLALDLAAHGRA
ncbi:MAG: SGNH/GDSL hydrolase family protein [Dokdonella sp.]